MFRSGSTIITYVRIPHSRLAIADLLLSGAA
jgi:hypothetical protein